MAVGGMKNTTAPHWLVACTFMSIGTVVATDEHELTFPMHGAVPPLAGIWKDPAKALTTKALSGNAVFSSCPSRSMDPLYPPLNATRPYESAKDR
jgi:hypothetical protein